MKQSPIDSAIEQLKAELLEILISNWILQRKFKKTADAIDKAIAELEKPYKIDEMESHVPQNAMIQMLDFYKKGLANSKTGEFPSLDLKLFAKSEKGQMLFEAIDHTTSLTDEEKIKIKNAYGALEGQNYKIKLTEKGLNDYIAQFKPGFSGTIERDASKFEHEPAGSLAFTELKDFFSKNLIPFIEKDCIDFQLINDNLDELTSKEFIKSLVDRSTTNGFLNLLASKLTEEQKLKLSQEVLAIKYEDPDNLKGARSITTISAYEKEKFSIITTINQAKDEQLTAGKKIIQEADKEAGIVRKMPKNYKRKLRIGDTEYAYSDFVTKESVFIDQKTSQKLLEQTNLARLEVANLGLIKAIEAKQKKIEAEIKNGNMDLAFQVMEHPGSYITPASSKNMNLFNTINEAIETVKDNPEVQNLLQSFNSRLDETQKIRKEIINNPINQKQSIRQFISKNNATEDYLDNMKKDYITNQIKTLDYEINNLTKAKENSIDINEKSQLNESLKSAKQELAKLKQMDYKKVSLNIVKINSSQILKTNPQLSNPAPVKQTEARERVKKD